MLSSRDSLVNSKDKTKQEKRSYYLPLKGDGSFFNSHQKIFFIKGQSVLTFSMNSNNIQTLRPLLLTNYPIVNTKKSTSNTKLKHPKAPQITASQNFTKQELYSEYTVFEGEFNEEGSWTSKILIESFSGSLFFQMVFAESNDNFKNFSITEFGRPQYVMILPEIKINEREIELHQLVVQTLLPYSIGPINRWRQVIRGQCNLGYNAFHFPPLQHLGWSGSLYSVKNQLALNPDIFPFEKKQDAYAALQECVKDIEKSMNSICFVDILLNHTSFDSEWIKDIPDAVYTPQNTPHLNAAFVLDRALQNFNEKISKSEYSNYSKGNQVESEQDINFLMDFFQKTYLIGLGIQEYFSFDIDRANTGIRKYLIQKGLKLVQKEADEADNDNIFAKSGYQIISESLQKYTERLGYEKLGVTFNLPALEQVVRLNPKVISYETIERALYQLRKDYTDMAKQYLVEAINNIQNQMRYNFLECKNPIVSIHNPISKHYFSWTKAGNWAANNGWIMNADPQENFAESNNFHYLRRTIIPWGDLIQLRYGKSKKDNQPLWKFMKNYVTSMAKIFHGFRIDNCHSTPIELGSYMLRKARNINKHLVVFAELFTQSPAQDALFVKQMGIEVLLREAMNFAGDIGQLQHSAYHYSEGEHYSLGNLEREYEIDRKTGEKMVLLIPGNAQSLIYDQTHDNQAFIKKFSIRQALSISSILAFSKFMVGSTRGFDELYPEGLSVVTERRPYLALPEFYEQTIDNRNEITFTYKLNPFDPQQTIPKKVALKGSWDNWFGQCVLGYHDKVNHIYTGRVLLEKPGKYQYQFIVDDVWVNDYEIFANVNSNHEIEVKDQSTKDIVYGNLSVVRKILNCVQRKLSRKFPEIYIGNQGNDIMIIYRRHYQKVKKYVMITRPECSKNLDPVCNSLVKVPGRLKKIEHVFWTNGNITVNSDGQDQNGNLAGNLTEIYRDHDISKFATIWFNEPENTTYIRLFNVPSSFTAIFKFQQSEFHRNIVQELDDDIEEIKNFEKLQEISLPDFNYIYFTCLNQENELTGLSPYVVPDIGSLPYSGFASVFFITREACIYNNLSHPLFNNLRNGYWLLDYWVGRLRTRTSQPVKLLTNQIQSIFRKMREVSKHDLPFYFTKFIHSIQQLGYRYITEKVSAHSQCPTLTQSLFFLDLLFSNHQFIADIPSGRFSNYNISISAGLPHFSSGWTRCWGRDTFISFRGMLLIPGLYHEAKSVIFMFAQSMRHGLIPNLLDRVSRPRYNARDATWWFVKSIFDYIQFTGDKDIMTHEVDLQFTSDSFETHQENIKQGVICKQSNLADVVQRIFQAHAEGIHFREWRAGFEIDTNMNNIGFQVDLKLDQTLGIIIGGNPYNCLTWMDKMGSSSKAGNKGIPATSRDGAPIELTALLKNCLDQAQRAFINQIYPYEGVKIGTNLYTFKEWSAVIKANFQKLYWISDKNNSKDKNLNQTPEDQMIKIRGIYKDTVFSTRPRTEFQLRPNVCIAMSVAPDLFTPGNAFKHLAQTQHLLIEQNSLGIKTLDQSSQEYISYYDNSDDSSQPRTAHGFSYHNGPEWVWVYSYFVMALKAMGTSDPQVLMSYFSNHKYFIEHNEWGSLPEMTNANGEYNRFSCPAQAWSVACMIECCYEILTLNTPKPQTAGSPRSSIKK